MGKSSQSVGFEPTLPEGIWFLVRRLNHSATTASYALGLYLTRQFLQVQRKNVCYIKHIARLMSQPG